MPLLAALLLQIATVPVEGGARVDFAREVRPLLSDRCFPCHGPDGAARRPARGLRLDLRAEATADRGGYAAIVPGDAGASEVLRRLRSADPGRRMPPPESQHRVSEAEIALLERWIAEGAEYAAHWAFAPPRRVPPPEVRDAAWPLDELDRFVLARLEAAGLAPAPEADREALVRRVSLDLTGLPPTPEEIDAFLGDPRPDSYERLVERLLGSPRHAERMALAWLDLARYADTYGYQNDVARRVWPWRDWVIRAFARNLPYDEFITWQLAGDLLPGATREQRLATTFNRLHRQTNEGGSVEEEFRVEYVADRVNTFSTAFLGLTVECARCHDHKFDPIGTEEYYGLFAFFQNVDECGLYSHFTAAVPTPALLLTTAEEDTALAALEERVRQAELVVAELRASRSAAFDAWLSAAAPGERLPDLAGRYSLDRVESGKLANEVPDGPPGTAAAGVEPVPGQHGGGLRLSGDAPARFPGVGEVTRVDPFSLALWIRTPDVKERAVVAHRSRAWTDAGSQGYQLLLEDGRLSAALVHFWPGDAICVRTLEPLPVGEWVHVGWTYDGSSRAAGLGLYLNGRRAATEVVRDRLTKGITGGGPPALTLGERFRDRGFTGGEVDELAVFRRELAPLEVAQLADGEALERLLARAPADWTDAERESVHAYWLAAHDDEARARRTELRTVRRELAERVDGIAAIMTMRELPAPKPAFVLERGSYERRGARVEAHTPACVLPFPPELPRDRLGLARWLTDPQNPLTARVAANRLWQIAFGRGLVETAEDFGGQGAPPSDPELLDALALDLVAAGWDQRALLRRLVTSRTYRQSSRPSPAARERDPENRLHSRAPSFRLPAETVRDAALFASGLLVEELGGPPVKPYQPPGLWREKSGVTYQRDRGPGLYRRSLYTFWKRTSPPPAMMLFDAAKRDVCAARRRTTNTPLQALVLWNDPQLVEAARALAQRALQGAGDDPERWISHAYRRAIGRRPAPRELRALAQLWRTERAAFAAEPERARELLAVGDAPADPELEPAGLAAGTLVAGAILSCDAFLTRR